jgi:hypothetical protein
MKERSDSEVPLQLFSQNLSSLQFPLPEQVQELQEYEKQGFLSFDVTLVFFYETARFSTMFMFIHVESFYRYEC